MNVRQFKFELKHSVDGVLVSTTEFSHWQEAKDSVPGVEWINDWTKDYYKAFVGNDIYEIVKVEILDYQLIVEVCKELNISFIVKQDTEAIKEYWKLRKERNYICKEVFNPEGAVFLFFNDSDYTVCIEGKHLERVINELWTSYDVYGFSEDYSLLFEFDHHDNFKTYDKH